MSKVLCGGNRDSRAQAGNVQTGTTSNLSQFVRFLPKCCFMPPVKATISCVVA